MRKKFKDLSDRRMTVRILKNIRVFQIAICIIAALGLAGLKADAQNCSGCPQPGEETQYIPLQGQLTNQMGDVDEEDGVFTIQVSVYTLPTGQDVVWQDTFENLPVINGVFNIILGSQRSLDCSNLNKPTNFTGCDLLDLLADQGQLYVGLTIRKKGDIDVQEPIEMLPRLTLLPIPLALKSVHSEESDLAEDSNSLQKRKWEDFFTSSDPNTAKAKSAVLADSSLIAETAKALENPGTFLSGFTVGELTDSHKGRIVEVIPGTNQLRLSYDIPGQEESRVRGVYIGEGKIQTAGITKMIPNPLTAGKFYYLNPLDSAAGSVITMSADELTGRAYATQIGYALDSTSLQIDIRRAQLFDNALRTEDQGNLLVNSGFEDANIIDNDRIGWESGGSGIVQSSNQCPGDDQNVWFSNGPPYLFQDIDLQTTERQYLQVLISQHFLTANFGARVFGDGGNDEFVLRLQFYDDDPTTSGGIISDASTVFDLENDSELNNPITSAPGVCTLVENPSVCIPIGTEYVRILLEGPGAMSYDDVYVQLDYVGENQCP